MFTALWLLQQTCKMLQPHKIQYVVFFLLVEKLYLHVCSINYLTNTQGLRWITNHNLPTGLHML